MIDRKLGWPLAWAFCLALTGCNPASEPAGLDSARSSAMHVARPSLAIERTFIEAPASAAAAGRFDGSVKLSSVGDAPVTIESVSKTCDCTSVEVSSFRLEPGESTTLSFSIDLRVGTKSRTSILVVSDDFRNPVQSIEVAWYDGFDVFFVQDVLALDKLLVRDECRTEIRIDSLRRKFEPTRFLKEAEIAVARDREGPNYRMEFDELGRCYLVVHAGDETGKFHPTIAITHPTLSDPLLCDVEFEVVPPVSAAKSVTLDRSFPARAKRIPLRPHAGVSIVNASVAQSDPPHDFDLSIDRDDRGNFDAVLRDVRNRDDGRSSSKRIVVDVVTAKHGSLCIPIDVIDYRGEPDADGR